MSLPNAPAPAGLSSAAGNRRKDRFHSVSTRVIVFGFAATVLTVLATSWLSLTAIIDTHSVHVAQQNDLLLSERGAKLEAWRTEADERLREAIAPGTAWHEEILGSLPSAAHSSLLPVPAELSAFLDRIEVASPPKISRPLAETEGDSCLPLNARVMRSEASDEVAFFVGACLAEGPLLALLRPPVGDFRGSRLLVVDATGRVLSAAGVRASTRLGETVPVALPAPAIKARVSSSATPRVEPSERFRAMPGHLLSYASRNGIPMVASVRSLAGSNWALVAEAARAQAFAPVSTVVKQLFIVGVCLVLLFTMLAYKMATAIRTPIEALQLGAQRIARGQVDYQIPLPPNRHDELGVLTRNFNEMMARLRTNQTEIEQDRVRLGEKNEELQHANEILSQLSITDGLTKLHNHRYFQDHLTREIKRVGRTKAPLSLILIDIDDFKMLNDTHGHAAGDEVLMSLASIMNDSARESDLIARYGGEEFVVLMPNTDLPGAVHLAEKIRMTVESTRLIIGDTLRPVDITISVGVAMFEGDRRDFFAEADRALYQAKAAGKNCVIIANSSASDENEGLRAPEQASGIAFGTDASPDATTATLDPGDAP